MQWIVRKSLELRLLLIVVAAGIIVFGIVQLRNMPIDIYPEFDPPLVEVQTEALGLSAAEMEALITVPLEADLLNGVAWLDQIYSESVAGMSSILLIFEEGTDPIRARQMVQERLTQTFALPNVSSPPTMLQPLSTTSRVMMVGLSSEEISLLEMGVLARWNIKPRLMGVPGVANVAIWGHRDRQLQVQVDPEHLEEVGVTLQQVIETTGEALWVSPLSYLESSSPGVDGWIDTPNQRLSIRHQLPISSAEDLAKVSVIGTEGLLLGDVANVVEDHQPLIGDAVLEEGPGLILVIEKFPGANTLEVTQGVEEVLEAMRPGLSGIQIDSTIFRPANYIENAISNINIAIVAGTILIAIVLGVFFFEWRTILISLVTIPLAIIAAAFVLYLRGESFNMMILAGLVIALAVIIDDAIIDVENIARPLRRYSAGDGEATLGVVLKAVLEMRSPIIYALLIIFMAIVPLFFIPGLAGSFFRPLVTSYVIALLVSLGVALIITPALSLTLLPRNTVLERRKPPLRQKMRESYSGFLGRFIQSSGTALLIAAVLAVAGLIIVPLLNQDLVPALKRTHLLIEWEAAPGTSRTEMNRIVTLAMAELRGIPGIQDVGSHVGRAITGDAVVGINSGEMWVTFDPSVDHDATVAAVEDVVNGYPGLFRTVQTYSPERTNAALIGAEQDMVVRIYGNDLAVLDQKALEIQEKIAGIEGVSEVRADRQVEEPQVEIEVDLAAAEANQIKPGDVRRQATTLLSGLRVGSLYEENKVFDVVVWGVPEVRDSLSDVEQLPIHTPAGMVPLGDLAEVRIVPAPIVIKRDIVSRFADVEVNVSGRAIADVAADIEGAISGVEFPLEYHAEVLGADAQSQAIQGRIISIIVTAAIGIFLLMQAAYSSWRLAAVGVLTLPVALSGGAIAALLSGGVLSIGSLFGFLAIFSIAVRNQLVMVKHLQNLQRDGVEPFGLDLVLQGTRDRFGPIMMTALAIILGLLPVVLMGDIAGYEIIRPMAIVIIGGLITSTLLNLFVIPSLYLRYGRGVEPEMVPTMTATAPSMGAD